MSLIDVMMLLMVIFMITAPMMQGGVDISLPRAEARPLDPKSGLVVTIDKAGAIHVDETVLTFNEFRATFSATGVRSRRGRRLSARGSGSAVRHRREGSRGDAGERNSGRRPGRGAGAGAIAVRRSEAAQLKGPMGVSLALHLSLVVLVLIGFPKGMFRRCRRSIA